MPVIIQEIEVINFGNDEWEIEVVNQVQSNPDKELLSSYDFVIKPILEEENLLPLNLPVNHMISMLVLYEIEIYNGDTEIIEVKLLDSSLLGRV